MSAMASRVTGLTIVYPSVYSGTGEKNIKTSRHSHLCGEFTGDRWSPRQRASKRKMFLFDDVIMYTMVSSALFLQRALHTMRGTNIMHSRKPSFVITPAFFIKHNTLLFCNIRGNEIRHILLKQFHLITPAINTIKHPHTSPCTYRNRDMFENRSVDFKFRFVPVHMRSLPPSPRLRLVQGLRYRHNPPCLWSAQCTGNRS